MSAETLRKAAALIRERAEAASTGPWKRYGMAGVAGVDWEIVDERRVECECGEPVALTGCATNADALHVASWHPAVALAVADWLDNEAHGGESLDRILADLGDPPVNWNYGSLGKALAVARAYLGSQS